MRIGRTYSCANVLWGRENVSSIRCIVVLSDHELVGVGWDDNFITIWAILTWKFHNDEGVLITWRRALNSSIEGVDLVEGDFGGSLEILLLGNSVTSTFVICFGSLSADDNLGNVSRGSTTILWTSVVVDCNVDLLDGISRDAPSWQLCFSIINFSREALFFSIDEEVVSTDLGFIAVCDKVCIEGCELGALTWNQGVRSSNVKLSLCKNSWVSVDPGLDWFSRSQRSQLSRCHRKESVIGAFETVIFVFDCFVGVVISLSVILVEVIVSCGEFLNVNEQSSHDWHQRQKSLSLILIWIGFSPCFGFICIELASNLLVFFL